MVSKGNLACVPRVIATGKPHALQHSADCLLYHSWRRSVCLDLAEVSWIDAFDAESSRFELCLGSLHALLVQLAVPDHLGSSLCQLLRFPIRHQCFVLGLFHQFPGTGRVGFDPVALIHPLNNRDDAILLHGMEGSYRPCPRPINGLNIFVRNQVSFVHVGFLVLSNLLLFARRRRSSQNRDDKRLRLVEFGFPLRFHYFRLVLYSCRESYHLT